MHRNILRLSTYLIKTMNGSKHRSALSQISQLILHPQFLPITSFLVMETLLFPARQVSDLLFGLVISRTRMAFSVPLEIWNIQGWSFLLLHSVVEKQFQNSRIEIMYLLSADVHDLCWGRGGEVGSDLLDLSDRGEGCHFSFCLIITARSLTWKVVNDKMLFCDPQRLEDNLFRLLGRIKSTVLDLEKKTPIGISQVWHRSCNTA